MSKRDTRPGVPRISQGPTTTILNLTMFCFFKGRTFSYLMFISCICDYNQKRGGFTATMLLKELKLSMHPDAIGHDSRKSVSA